MTWGLSLWGFPRREGLSLDRSNTTAGLDPGSPSEERRRAEYWLLGRSAMKRQATDALVLLVEDDPVIRDLIAAILEIDLGVSVTVATDGAVGLELAKRLEPDLVLLSSTPADPGCFVLALRMQVTTSEGNDVRKAS